LKVGAIPEHEEARRGSGKFLRSKIYP